MATTYATLNGIQFGGSQWDPASYPATANAQFLSTRNIRFIRVPLNVRAIYPTDGGSLNAPTVTNMKAFADECVLRGVQVVWDLHTSGSWPTDSSTGRVTFDQISDFWTKIHSSAIGESHLGVLGYSLLNRPTMERTRTANNDLSVVNGSVSWNPSTDPSTDMLACVDWLEDLMRRVVGTLRSAGSTKRLFVPLLYSPTYRGSLLAMHPRGAYLTGAAIAALPGSGDTAISAHSVANCWYEASMFPLATVGLNGEAVTQTFDGHNAQFLALGYTGFAERVITQTGTGTPAPAPVSAANALPTPTVEYVAIPVPGLEPSPPTALNITAFDSAAFLAWSPPQTLNGASTLSYEVTFSGIDTVYTTNQTSLMVTGLENLVTYTVNLRAITEFGNSTYVTDLVTPDEDLGFPDEGEEPGPQPPEPIPEPMVAAFPAGAVFMPSNWMLPVAPNEALYTSVEA